MKLLHFKWLITTLLCSGAASAATLDTLLKNLKSPTQTVREQALEELSDWSEEGFNEKESLQLLQAASGTYPATGEYSTSAELVSFLRGNLTAKHIQPLVTLFPKLDLDGKWFALDVLAHMKDDKTAIKTYLGLVGKHAATLDGLPVTQLKKQQASASILFPALLQYTKFPMLQYDIYDLALSYVYEDWVTVAALRKQEAPILKDYRVVAGRLKAAQQDTGIQWRWEKPYNDDRYLGGVLLDLIGFINTKTANGVLKEALSFKDPYLQGWAAISLVYNEQEVPKDTLSSIAASNEMRWTLYDYLLDAEHEELYPAEYRNQQAMGASDLVNVLIDQDYLGYEPDQVEFVQKFTRQEDNEVMDYYLYKFTDRAGTTYAGVAGPYSPARVVTVSGGDDTHSAFIEWSKLDPEAHFQAILDDLYGEDTAVE